MSGVSRSEFVCALTHIVHEGWRKKLRLTNFIRKANIVIKSNDGQQFRVHNFFLKASRYVCEAPEAITSRYFSQYSPAFRDMLSMSTGLNDGTVPLHETGADVALFPKAISGDSGNAGEGCPTISKTALRLFKLARKYDICGPSQRWIM